MQKKDNMHTLGQGSTQYLIGSTAQAVALHGIFSDLGADDNSGLRVRADNILGRQGAEAHRAAAL